MIFHNFGEAMLLSVALDRQGDFLVERIFKSFSGKDPRITLGLCEKKSESQVSQASGAQCPVWCMSC